jgi:Type III restriction enzyme, res subunit.
LNHPQQDEKKYLVISSKRYCYEKSIDKYDVGNIDTYLRRVVPHLEKDSHIGILLRDKTDFLTICSNAHSKKYLTHLIRNEDVFSIKDIDDWLNELRSNLNSIEKIKEFCKQDKPVLNLRIHQKYIANMIVGNETNRHLITAVCRSGKSYMIAECIRQYMEEYNMHKFLYITNRPSETFNQTKKDIFDKYEEFNSLSTTVVHDVSDQEEKNENFLHLISKQFYQAHLNELSEEYDVIFFDEAHEASSTEKPNVLWRKPVMRIPL